jgi:murein DD-endopeptidase MepM/ murein hydrolase activator NlpD
MPPQRHRHNPSVPLSTLLRRGVSLAGVLGVLGSSSVWAQTSPVAPVSPAGSPAPAAAEAPIASPKPAAIAAPESLPIVEGLTQPNADTLPAVPAPAAPAKNSPAESAADSASFIDSTPNYSLGATNRGDAERAAAAQAAARNAAPSVQAADGSYSPSISQPLTLNDPGLSVIEQSTPTLQNYYKRTLLPPGRLGNGNISLLFPLSIPAPITSAFGWRIHPISGDRRFHSGTDIGAALGTPVLAAYAGKVTIADFLGGYGLAIMLEHNNGTQQTLYGHLSEIFVKPGEVVKQGAVIGRVGSTGNSTGPHLHFEFRQRSSEGWVVMDAGTQLEYSLAQFAKALQVAGKNPDLSTLLALQMGNDVFTGEAKFTPSTVANGKLPLSRAILTEQIRSFAAARGIRLPTIQALK